MYVCMCTPCTGEYHNPSTGTPILNQPLFIKWSPDERPRSPLVTDAVAGHGCLDSKRVVILGSTQIKTGDLAIDFGCGCVLGPRFCSFLRAEITEIYAW